MKELLLSTDMNRYNEIDNTNERLFLDASVNLALAGNCIAIQSCDQTGSDLLADLLEQVTRVFVGSDSHIYHTLDKALAKGKLGESHICENNRVWFTKTNYPFNSRNQIFSAQKMIVIVRDPSELIKELADEKNLFASQDRLNLIGNYSSNYTDWWEKWVTNQTQNIVHGHDHLMNTVSVSIPTYFVRFEDIIRNPQLLLNEIFKIAFSVESLEGTILERRIEEVSNRYGDMAVIAQQKGNDESLNELYSLKQV